MATRKLPNEALAHYLGLGPDRSYQAVADHFGVSKRTVTDRAVKEDWQEAVRRAEAEARRGAKDRAAETLEELNDRHLKMLRVVQRKALDALRTMPLTTAMEAVRALDIAIRNERLILGEPTERTASSIEEVIRGEYERWLVKEVPAHAPEQAGDLP